ncbi:helix-turn-helix domain-containing protein [Brevibacterium sp. 91QC2O2]|uniref:helix-turn-helix domain-containing protein n=1 Tax=Brevibacterium sp. 91QC2O2 TaxID=2968458 RepID=UPI00211B998F|nr:helix-turn-helix domain-containing protein [Brevibacterium sp. 91QC2O2]MCQ9367304.1 helix-turn-helix domain-containing protein [Brevibacterium sp. 91QC2O2]
MTDELLTTKEASPYTKFSERSLQRLFQQQVIAARQPTGVGGQWRVWRSDLEAWVNGNA